MPRPGRVASFFESEVLLMLLTGKATFMGVRSGVKDGQRWANVYLDALDDLTERVQLFVRDELIDSALVLVPGSEVIVEARVYANQKGNAGIRLSSIRPAEKVGK